MKAPFRSETEFLNDVDEVLHFPARLDLWWLGQSGFLIHHREGKVLIDPYLSDSLTSKYAATDKPHTRMVRRVVDPAVLASRLGGISIITSSHSHTDHLDPETLRPLMENSKIGCVIVAPKPCVQLAYERSGAGGLQRPPKFVGLDEGGVEEFPGVTVTAVPAAHETIDRDQNGHCKYLGYVFEFAPYFINPTGSLWRKEKEWTVFHSGDTLLFDGMVERLRPFNIDMALLPINGRAPERRVAGNLNGREAAWLAKEIGAKIVIPCHYDMFEFNTADPREEFVPECERLGQPYRVLRLGERFSSSEIPPP